MKYLAYGVAENKVITEKIDSHVFQHVKEVKKRCLFAVELEEKFSLLFDNYAEFEFDLLRLAEISLIWNKASRDHAESMQKRLLLDRRVVNLLTSSRLYLDQSEHGISMIFGKTSTQLTEFKDIRCKLYDKHLGYRFMEALRNHVQHASLAVDIISHNNFLSSGDDEDYLEYIAYPLARVTSLRENGRFKKQILNELSQNQDEIDLRKPIREYMSCLVLIHGFLRKKINSFFPVSRKEYESSVKKYSTINGKKVYCPVLKALTKQNKISEEIPLPTHFLDYYDKLVKYNTINDKLQHSTASNTTQKRKYKPDFTQSRPGNP